MWKKQIAMIQSQQQDSSNNAYCCFIYFCVVVIVIANAFDQGKSETNLWKKTNRNDSLSMTTCNKTIWEDKRQWSEQIVNPLVILSRM